MRGRFARSFVRHKLCEIIFRAGDGIIISKYTMAKHKVVHFEIPTADFKKATEFYTKVFGWKMEPWEDKYLMAMTTDVGKDMSPTEPGGINGGFYIRKSKGDVPTFVIETDSIDQTLKDVEKAGGKVTRKKEPIGGDMGFMAEFTDTDGNEISLFETAKKK